MQMYIYLQSLGKNFSTHMSVDIKVSEVLMGLSALDLNNAEVADTIEDSVPLGTTGL